MKHLIFSVRDLSAAAYGRPFYSTARGLAIRSFMDEVNRPSEDNLLYQHPEDFTLHYLGTFDDSDALFDLLTIPECVANALDFRSDR